VVNGVIRVPTKINYNPYDLVKLIINGKPIDGRPIAFDSNIINQKTMKNSFGAFVKPIKAVTVCPDCGQGMTVDLRLPDPPFLPVSHSCPQCCPAPPPLIDPFVNPLQTGRVPIAELDPLLHNPDKPLKEQPSPVAERFVIPEKALPSPGLSPEPAAGSCEGELVPATATAKTQTGRVVPLPPVEEIAEEVDFDDSSMVDDE
jgi:hypothetical protein